VTGTRRWTVTDGREMVGHVELADDGIFIAVDAAGRVLGRFDSRLEAFRALDIPRERTRNVSAS
jgi:hypothetical protein